VSTWELDHLIFSMEHKSTSLFVLFYSPTERESKVQLAAGPFVASQLVLVVLDDACFG
jgi:hypothetical protein